MNLGIFGRIKNTFKRFPKVVLISTVFLLTLFSFKTKVFADNTWDNYKYLFNTLSAPLQNQMRTGINTNTLVKKSWITDSANQTIPDVWLGFSFTFGDERNSGKNAEYSWDHINDSLDGDDEVFMLRSCDTGSTTNCIYHTISYSRLAYVSVAGESQEIFRYANNSDYTKHQDVDLKTKWTNRYGSQALSGWKKIDGTSIDVDFLKKEPQTMSLWYCADQPNHSVVTSGDIEADPNAKPGEANDSTPGFAASVANDPDIQQFGDFCDDNNKGGKTYFKIAEINVDKPTSFATEATNEANQTTETLATAEVEKSPLPSCGIINGSVMGCVAQIIYYLVYRPIAWFAGIMGKLFDFFLGYSLSDQSYRADFAVSGWKLVRDISNIFFIIILVWTGFSTALGISKISMKSVVPNLIINALLINFSLFGTRVIIDLSNIFARVFYNQVTVCDGACKRDENGVITNIKDDGTGYTPLSEKIVSSFNPQKMFQVKVLSSQNASPAVGVNGAKENDVGTLSESETAGYFTIVSLLGAFILFGVAMMFWKTAFFFLGRVIGLYIAMIFSPFAFLARGNMPIVSGIKELGWDNWLKDLSQYALLAPIFVFFLYIIYSFLDSDFLKVHFSNLSSPDLFQNVISIAVPMLIVYYMIKQGVALAEGYAGKIGQSVQNFAQKAAGFAGGVALGGTALVGGRVLGAGASALSKSKVGSALRDAAPNSWLARKALGGLNKASAGSYDVRQTAIGKGLFKQMNVDTNQKGLNALSGVGLGLGTDQRKGGYESDVKRRKEALVKNTKLFEEGKMSEDKIKAYNDKMKAQYENKINEMTDELIAKNTNMSKKDVAKMRKNGDPVYHTEKAAAMTANPAGAAKIDSVAKPEQIKSEKDITRRRKQEYVKGLQKPVLMNKESIIGAAFGAGTRDGGNKAAAAEISKEIKKSEKEASNTKRADDLSKALGEKIESLKEDLKNTTKNIEEVFELGADTLKDLNNEQRQALVEDRELEMSGELAAAQASHEKAVDDFKNAKPEDQQAAKERLAQTKKDLLRTEKNINKGKDLFNKLNSIDDNITKTTEKKVQVDEKIENAEYRKERKVNEEKKNKGGEPKKEEKKDDKPKT